MSRLISRCFGLMARPSRDFVPAADSLSCAHKKVSKESAPAKPALRAALRCSNPRAALNSLRYAAFKQSSRSQFLKRAAHAPWAPALLSGFEGGSQQSPTARLRRRLGRLTRRPSGAAFPDEPGVQPALTGVKGRSGGLVTRTAARAQRVASGRQASARSRAPLLAASRSCAVQGLFFGDFLLAPQKKVTPPPGGTPGTALAINLKYR